MSPRNAADFFPDATDTSCLVTDRSYKATGPGGCWHEAAWWGMVGANNIIPLRLLGHMKNCKAWLEARGAAGRRQATVRWDGRREPSRVLERLEKEKPAAWLCAGIPLLKTKIGVAVHRTSA